MSQLAAVLGEQPKVLSYWLYKASSRERYASYSLPKKRGGWRHISAPAGGLKRIQTKLARLLAEIYNDLEQSRVRPNHLAGAASECVLAHGFKDRYSIITNARVHRDKRYVFNVDLEDFFPSINFGRVRGFFISNNSFNLSPEVATLIAQIACYRNELPQGAPCSPVISNLITHVLDIQLHKMAVKGNCSYSRYADDLTFSTNEKEFPKAIARTVAGTTDRWVAGDGLLARVYAGGFRLNHDKTRMQLRQSRQEATGLTVNDKINVDARYYKRARAMCDHLFSGGKCHEIVDGIWREVPSSVLQGRLDFIHAVRRSRVLLNLDHVSKKHHQGAFKEREARFSSEQPGFSALYKKLLNYRSFHGIERPIIVGEGVTDGLYINAAIKTIGPLFPNLYDTKTDSVLVDFYKHTDKRKFYQVDEGAPGLKHFVRNYPDIISPFKKTAQSPVIVIVDNDPEGRDVLKVAASRYGKKIDGTTEWCHLTSNLYIMPTPGTGSHSHSIEDLFDSATLSETINGRTFTKKNDFDSSLHYGKTEFVSQIVRPKRSTIDWGGFDPLLKRIEEVILDYEKQLLILP